MAPREPTDELPQPDREPLVDSQDRSLPSTTPSRRSSSWKAFWEGVCNEYGPRWVRLAPQPYRWIAFVLVISFPLAWKYSDQWWPWAQQQYRQAFPAPLPPLPKAKQFAIAIARVEQDTNDDLRTLLVDGLRDLPGVQVLRFDRATNLYLADDPKEEEYRIQQQAQTWLKESQADILIWGQVLPATANKERMVRLFVTGRDTDLQETVRLGTNQTIEFPVAAREPLEEVVRSQVLARFSAFPSRLPVARPLRSEIDRMEVMVRDWPAGQTRALLHRALGNAWQTVGTQMGEAVALERSVLAYQESLAGLPRISEPLEWVKTQHNLGNILMLLGERENNTKRLEQSIVAFRMALEERTQERVPLDWASTQDGLGVALSSLGERENGTKHLEESIIAIRLALKEWTRERTPQNWATAQNSLGNTLQVLGEQTHRTKYFEEALVAFRLALEVTSRDQAPLNWAGLQCNLGNALSNLGERENGITHLQESVDAYRQSLEESPRGEMPFHWACVQNNLGLTLRVLGERKNDATLLKEAEKALELALEVFVDSKAEYYVLNTRSNLEMVRAFIKKR